MDDTSSGDSGYTEDFEEDGGDEKPKFMQHGRKGTRCADQGSIYTAEALTTSMVGNEEFDAVDSCIPIRAEAAPVAVKRRAQLSDHKRRRLLSTTPPPPAPQWFILGQSTYVQPMVKTYSELNAELELTAVTVSKTEGA